MKTNGQLAMKGDLGLKVVRRPGPVLHPTMDARPTVRQVLAHGLPRLDLPAEVNRWRASNWRAIRRAARDVLSVGRCRAPALLGTLYLTKLDREGRPTFLGLAGARVVTDAFADLLVDSFQDTESNLLDEFVYHGVGETNTAEDASDTDLLAELTTEYDSDNTRATGSQTEGASTNIFRTVGTNTFDASVALVEHGIFNNATVGSGTLLDRTVFAVVNLGSGESLQSTYDLTITAGS